MLVSEEALIYATSGIAFVAALALFVGVPLSSWSKSLQRRGRATGWVLRAYPIATIVIALALIWLLWGVPIIEDAHDPAAATQRLKVAAIRIATAVLLPLPALTSVFLAVHEVIARRRS